VIYFFAMAGAKQMLRVQRSERGAVLASQAKSDFLANMSHELRTPLNAIIGFSEMIEAGYFGKVNMKQKERIHDIHFCGTHLLELINDILEFSKGEAGKIELHIDKVSVGKVINESVRVFAERSRSEGVTVVSNAPKDMPLVMADTRKIKQILLNLISNAVKFTESGGTVEAGCFMDDDNNMVITVTDTGAGIAEKDIPKALSTFGQTHTDPSKGGTGLGLPLCKMFAELHGGHLAIQSIVDVGTKVSIILPSDRVIWSSTNVSNLNLDGVLKSVSGRFSEPKDSNKA
jgi:signal transduction histidine kinase